MGAPYKHKDGDTLNGIVLIKRLNKTGNDHNGEFQCPDCSKGFTAKFSNVMSGNTASCGCKMKIGNNLKHGHNRKGKTSSEYRIWAGMIDRCENINTPAYSDYGGRGIKVCERWRNSFESFLADVGRRPSKNHSLDRWPNNNGNYEPGNFRWATQKEQCRNTRKTLHVDYNGERKPLRQICEELNLDFKAVWHRIAKEKLSVKEAIEKPFRILPKGRRNTLIVKYNGEDKQLKEWCNIFYLDYPTMRWAIFKKGMSAEDAFAYKKRSIKVA